MSSAILTPEEHVLPTLEGDGSRRWLTPTVSAGGYWRRRRVVGYGLIALFVALPFVSINGKPAVLLDIVARRFVLFGATFLPTDTLLLALLMLCVFLGVFLATALFGRVWCGWGCPQTVYMEFVYRPIERFFDQTGGRGGKPSKKLAGWRRAARYATYLVVSFALANVFLAYFVGVERLATWMQTSPVANPSSFAVMAVTTGLMMFDFCFFREQLCLVACPYGRFQSVLLDRVSLIVGYDARRGEPRGPGRDPEAKGLGDFVDCGQFVDVIP
ncbi:MAG: 4Fe-4S dicluster domain-containing protein, partial [Planctomycetota bacterium]